MPNLSRAVRPAAYDIATIGSGAGPLIRSDNQRLSKPTASISSTTAPNSRTVERGPRPEPEADAHLRRRGVVGGVGRGHDFDGTESHRAVRLGILGR